MKTHWHWITVQRAVSRALYRKGDKLKQKYIDKFWKLTNKTETCWLWSGYKDQDGYGQIYIDNKRLKAHRFSYELLVGKIPNGFLVCHHCDNPSCVRPDHLFLGTQSDNMLDCGSKGRNSLQTHPELVRGEKHWGAKLTEESVRTIRLDHSKGISTECLSELYGVSYKTIWDIIKGKSWTHIK